MNAAQQDSRTLLMLQQQLHVSEDEARKWSGLPYTVKLEGDRNCLLSTNGQYAIAMAVNLLCRLHPIVTHLRVSLDPDIALKTSLPGVRSTNLKAALIEITGGIEPPVDISFDVSREKHDSVLSIGNTTGNDRFKVAIGSDGWNAFLSRNRIDSLPANPSSNPVGAYFAACLGCGEIFKEAFRSKGDALQPERGVYDPRHRIRSLEGCIKFSTLDFSVNSDSAPNPVLPETLDISETFVAGVGAGGGALCYTLASVPEITGHLGLVDPDEVTLSNLNRYIYATKNDATRGVSKVSVVARLFDTRPIALTTFHGEYLDFIKIWKNRRIDTLVTTVDTDQTRRDIQWDLPRIIFDAATTGTEYYAMRVELEDGACLNCTHERSPEPLEVALSRLIGLSTEEVANLRKSNGRFSTIQVNRIQPFCDRNGISTPHPRERFSDWLANHCGEMKLQEQAIMVPIPHATVMPGILLAGQIIRDRCYPQHKPRNMFVHDSFSTIDKSFGIHVAPRVDCGFCNDLKVLARYHEKWSDVFGP